MRKLMALLCFCLLACVLAAPATAQNPPGALRAIPTADGYRLNAYVAIPAGNGPFPLVVMPSSWGLGLAEYVGIANRLAGRGYVVVSYASRGFGAGCALSASCGAIDIAGPATIADVSTVIDWALANTPSDAGAIGISGISYGAGSSLLAAERDPRIKAVAALSGWASLVDSLYANRTPSAQGVALLSFASYLGKPGPLMQQVNQRVAALDFLGAVQAVLPDADVRSPAAGVDALNRHGAAVLLANAYEDSLFVPGQLVDFYNRLTVPKRLVFAHGDHATNEMFGALGLPNEVYDAVDDWFDRYLKGVDNGVDRQPPVQLKTQGGRWLAFADWSAAQANATTYALGDPRFDLFTNPTTTGRLSTDSASTWNYAITGGYPTAAYSGLIFVSGILTAWQAPPVASLPLVSRANAAVWSSAPLARDATVAGMPSLHITVTPDTAQLSLYAYLYSVDAFGVGQLMSWKPYTFADAVPGVPRTIDLRLEATGWDVPAGHRLALVVGTVDLRYAGVTPPGSRAVFSSPVYSPSTLSVPLH